MNQRLQDQLYFPQYCLSDGLTELASADRGISSWNVDLGPPLRTCNVSLLVVVPTSSPAGLVGCFFLKGYLHVSNVDSWPKIGLSTYKIRLSHMPIPYYSISCNDQSI